MHRHKHPGWNTSFEHAPDAETATDTATTLQRHDATPACNRRSYRVSAPRAHSRLAALRPRVSHEIFTQHKNGKQLNAYRLKDTSFMSAVDVNRCMTGGTKGFDTLLRVWVKASARE